MKSIVTKIILKHVVHAARLIQSEQTKKGIMGHVRVLAQVVLKSMKIEKFMKE